LELTEYKRPFEILDFSGGITDEIFIQDPRRAQTIDNLLLKFDRSLDSRPGSVIDDLSHEQIPAGNQRIGALINYYNNDKLFVQSARNIYYRNPSVYVTLEGPTLNPVFSTGDVSSTISYTQWNGHLYLTSDVFPRPMKVFKDGSGNYQVRSSGLPSLANTPAISVGLAGTNNYIYSFHYEYKYTSLDRTFENFGPVTQVLVNNSSDPGSNPNSISLIPIISNGSSDNWDTTNIKIYIYRTLAGGQTSYLIGSVTNGTTTFNDNFSDSSINNNFELYIDDGTLDNDAPPLSKYIHIVNNTAYYAHLKDSLGNIFSNTLRQSIPGQPDSVPQAFDIVVEDIITGMSSTKSVPIVLCKKYIYRIDNSFDQFGAGVPLPVRISDTAGCISNSSIVQAEDYIFWLGNDGIYGTDGYRVSKVSDGNNQNYQTFLEQTTQQTRLQGKFDEKNRRIFWAIQRDSSNLDNDSCLILDLRWGVSADMPLTTWSGKSFRPSAIEFFNKQLYRADIHGYVLIHDDAYATDPKIDHTIAAADWNLETIIWEYDSILYNFGSTAQRKWVSKILLTGANKNNTSIQITAINDQGKIVRDLKEIRWRRNFVWGSDDFVWGSNDCIWDATGLIEQWRRMPTKSLRLSYLQIKVTNSFTIISNSDNVGLATFNGVTKMITLPSGYSWPDNSVDYEIATQVDGYQKLYTVISQSGDTIQVIDPDSSLPSGVLKWELFGYKKGEPLNMLSYTLYWDFIGETQVTYHTGQDGANA